MSSSSSTDALHFTHIPIFFFFFHDAVSHGNYKTTSTGIPSISVCVLISHTFNVCPSGTHVFLFILTLTHSLQTDGTFAACYYSYDVIQG